MPMMLTFVSKVKSVELKIRVDDRIGKLTFVVMVVVWCLRSVSI